jgi:Gpi18-like mannosyltransferase
MKYMKKELALDKFIRNLIDKYLFEIAVGLLILISVFIRFKLAPNTELSPDYDFYYREWVEFYRQNGIIKGLSNAPGDYYVPFNVIYALSSLFPCEAWVPLSIVPGICELISAFFIYKIFYLLTGKKRCSVFIGVMTLYLPFVIFDGALWKQVDAVYTCFLMISIYKLLKQQYRASIVWYSVAFAFKLQSILFLPLYLIIYITGGFNGSADEEKELSKKTAFSILEFLWIPVVYLIAGLPEVLAKHGLRATYFAYLEQTGELDSEGYGMVSYFPNIYNWGFDDHYKLLSTAAVMVLAAVLVVIAVFCYRFRERIDRNLVLYLAIWTSWTCVILLPGMHERYDYAMLILLTPFAITVRKKIMPFMVVANICSLIVYGITLFGAKIIDIAYISVFYVASYLFVTADIIGLLNGGNERSEA